MPYEDEGHEVNLSQYDEQFAWDSLEADIDAPDGIYIVRVDRVSLKQTKNGRDTLSWKLVVADGEYSGAVLWQNHYFHHRYCLQLLKGDLLVAGFRLTSVAGLLDILEELEQIHLRVSVVKEGDFRRVSFLKRVEPPVQGALTAEEIPF